MVHQAGNEQQGAIMPCEYLLGEKLLLEEAVV